MKKTLFVLLLIFITSELSFCSPDNSANTYREKSFKSVSDIGADKWKEYTNSQVGFSIKYLSDYSVNSSYVYTFFGTGHDINGVSFTIPDNLSNGTNLSGESYISVEWISGGSGCDTRKFLSGELINESIGSTSKVTYTMAENGEAATGNYYDQTVYVVSSGSYCFCIRLFIHSTNLANYDPGTVRAYDRAAIMQTYYDMIATFQMP